MKPKAKQKQATDNKAKASAFGNIAKSESVHVRKETAKAINTSEKTLYKAKVIAKEKPELLDAVDAGKRSIDSAYNQILKEKQKEARKNADPVVMDRKYQVIVVDPPWPIEKVIREERPNQGEFDYPTMTVEQITDLPIEDLSDSE